MSDKVKDVSIKNHTYCFFDDIENFDPNNIKINEESYKDILTYYVEYLTIKHLKYIKISSVNPLYLIFSKVNGCFEEIDKV